jgi:hypothetical protein
MFAQNLFLWYGFICDDKQHHSHSLLLAPKQITAQCRLEAFERQIRLTSERCGAANTRYGWLGSRKKGIVRILMDGFVSIETTQNADSNPGIYLSPENRAFRLSPIRIGDPKRKIRSREHFLTKTSFQQRTQTEYAKMSSRREGTHLCVCSIPSTSNSRTPRSPPPPPPDLAPSPPPHPRHRGCRRILTQ